MIHTTIGDVIDGDTDHLDTDGNTLYLVCTDSEVRYVSPEECSPILDLRRHLGLDGEAPSDLGKFINCSLPDSRAWQVQMWGRPPEVIRG